MENKPVQLIFGNQSKIKKILENKIYIFLIEKNLLMY